MRARRAREVALSPLDALVERVDAEREAQEATWTVSPPCLSLGASESEPETPAPLPPVEGSW